MKLSVSLICASLFVSSVTSFKTSSWNTKFTNSRMSSLMMLSDVEIFGGKPAGSALDIQSVKPSKDSSTQDKLKLQAQQLRKEAAELEVALREEARAKGLPEEVINKLIPITSAPKTAKSSSSQVTSSVASKVNQEKETVVLPATNADIGTSNEIRKKLGYLNIGDPVRFTSELQRIKMRGNLRLWDTYQPTNNYNVNNYQLTSKTNIDPVKLKLDDVGYDYKQVLIAALFIGSTCGLSSSYIGGQLGFLLGYASALFPILIVGIGSIAPALIGDVLLGVQCALDEKVRDQIITLNAGKFLVGYILGLPVARFDSGPFSNVVEFFQVKPTTGNADEERKYFAKKRFSQDDISRSSIVCLASSTAECINFGEASGNASNDVNMLQELVLAVEPALTPDAVQNHIRWSALNAYNILNTFPEELKRLVVAFKEKRPIEECIAAIEGKDE